MSQLPIPRTTQLTNLILQATVSTDTPLESVNKSGVTLFSVDGSGNVVAAGTLGVTGSLAASGGVTVPTGETVALTDANSLTVGGLIVPQYFYHTYRQAAGETPTTATIWTAPEGCILVGIVERHLVAGSDAGAVTMSFAKDPTGTAPGAGTGLVTAALSLKTTINTNQAAALSGTVGNVTFAAGDGLSLVLTGVMTAVAGCSVTFQFKRH